MKIIQDKNKAKKSKSVLERILGLRKNINIPTTTPNILFSHIPLNLCGRSQHSNNVSGRTKEKG